MIKPAATKPTPEARLRACVARLDPKIQKLFRSVRTALRKRFPTANELAHDYGQALVIGYAPTENGIDAVVAIRGDSKGVSLYFSQGPKLPDPNKLLRGKGKQVRFLQLESARQLSNPDVAALLAATIEQARVTLPAQGKGKLIIKSDGAKKPARQKPSK